MNLGKNALSLFLCISLLIGTIAVSGTIAIADDEGANYSVGDIIEYGTYPQNEVKDIELISALNLQEGIWSSYGYYSGTGNLHDGEMVPFDCMLYKDVIYDGSKYRAVSFNNYRPFATGESPSATNHYQEYCGYSPQNIYWFKYEPVKWRVLNPETGLVMCTAIIDSQAYSNYIKYNDDDGEYYNNSNAYASDWVTSSIREWLNQTFYNTAFSSEQKANILLTANSNSSPYIEKYDSNDTDDNVFLLSWSEVLNSSFGFNPDFRANDVSRQLQSTAYAECQGVYGVNFGEEFGDDTCSRCGMWWLRSPGDGSNCAAAVNIYGRAGAGEESGNSGFIVGVVPALRLQNLKSDPTGAPLYNIGDIIEFGSYPQSRVADSNFMNLLNTQIKSDDWVSYEYYSGNGYGTMNPGQWMRYADIEYNNQKYRAVQFDYYRPYFVVDPANTYLNSPKIQQKNGYTCSDIYWFKYEPLTWTVIDEEKNLVICNNVIDSQPYNNCLYSISGNFYNDENGTVYANNWEHSSVRDWLNNDFYSTAFSKTEKAGINTTSISNKCYQTITGETGYEYLDSGNTTDSIFLLSYEELINCSVENINVSQSTDYAKCQGVETESDSATWILRTPTNGPTYSINAIRSDDNSSVGQWYSICTFTGIRPVFALKNDGAYETGDIIEYGSYPQNEVTDIDLVSELNSQSGTWVSYNYYSGSGSFDDGQMVSSDYMRYKDITYNGNKYRAVTFDRFRPYRTGSTSSASNSYQDDNGYTTGTVYWFKYEPLEWRILDIKTGLIICETVIDSQPYNNYIVYNSNSANETYAYFGDANMTYYASDYANSSIRTWLNDNFYNTAFSNEEKENILTSTLSNEGYYTLTGTSGYEVLDSNNTEDKVFLISYDDAINSAYGFSPSSSDYDIAKRLQGTDYAKSQGLQKNTNSAYFDNSWWWLRSPGFDSINACYVSSSGYSGGDHYYYVYNTYCGVVPALYLRNLKTGASDEPNLLDPELSVSTGDVNYGETATIISTMSENATGTVTFYLDTSEIGVDINTENGVAIYEINGLSIGKHTVRVVYNGDDKYNKSEVITSEFIVNAVACPLVINYFYTNGNKAAESHSSNVEIFSSFSVPSPKITGYSPDFETVEGEMDDLNGKTVNVTYSLNTYTATLLVDGKEYKKVPFTYGQGSIFLPVVPEKEGYSGEWESYSLGASDIEINAVYTPNKYNLTYISDGKEISSSILDYGASVWTPRDPSKDGYTFTGWDKEIPATMPAEDLTFTALFTANTYEVDLVVDGEVIETVDYTYDDENPDLPAVPEKEGYTGEWVINQENGNVDIHAEYTPITYYATFMADGKQVGEKVPFTVESTSITEPEVPAKNGYTGKWSEYTLAASDITINAVYTKNVIPEPPTPTYKLPTNFNEQTAAYNTMVTINVKLNNIPEGAKVYINGKEATVNGNTYSADIGQATSTKNVKVEVKYGTKVLDSTTLTVKVDTGFFAKLISFFSNFLFNMFSWKKVNVNF